MLVLKNKAHKEFLIKKWDIYREVEAELKEQERQKRIVTKTV